MHARAGHGCSALLIFTGYCRRGEWMNVCLISTTQKHESDHFNFRAGFNCASLKAVHTVYAWCSLSIKGPSESIADHSSSAQWSMSVIRRRSGPSLLTSSLASSSISNTWAGSLSVFRPLLWKDSERGSAVSNRSVPSLLCFPCGEVCYLSASLTLSKACTKSLPDPHILRCLPLRYVCPVLVSKSCATLSVIALSLFSYAHVSFTPLYCPSEGCSDENHFLRKLYHHRNKNWKHLACTCCAAEENVAEPWAVTSVCVQCFLFSAEASEPH